MSRRIAAFRLLLIAAAIVLGVAALANPAGAQDDAPATSISAVAVPFVGTYEVWCTDRNPAPNSICARHHGSPAIDIGMEIGEPIYAAGTGIVTNLETTCRAIGCRGGAGLFVELTHADGTASRYLHLDSVAVAEDDVVEVGELIGTSGATGQSSSPHLHYDERNTVGTRIDMGTWFGCVGGDVVQYPDVFGTTDWNQVEYGSLVSNEGFGCLADLQVPAEAPLVFTGAELLGVSTPDAETDGQVRIVTIEGDEDADPTTRTFDLAGGELLRVPAATNTTVSVQFRAQLGVLWSPWSESVVLLAAADDRPTCFGLHATVEGTNGTTGPDVIIGTEGSDSINSGSGNDLVCGLGGNDTIEAGDGDDRVSGGDGRDFIFGGDGRDTIFGGSGADTIDGGSLRDRIDGGSGGDTLDGGSGSDLVNGASGDDVIRGSGGRDRLRGGQGEDLLIGGRGNDRIQGNPGVDSLRGGVGRDRCDAGGQDGDTTESCEL
jgi:hypothetical protein